MSPVYTEAAAWDMRQGYFNMALEALGASFDARLSKDAPRWLDLLDGLYSRVRPFFKKDERERLEPLLNAIKDGLYQDFEGFEDREADLAMSATIDQLDRFEKDLIMILNKHHLLAPHRTDPKHAGIEGI